MVSGSSWTTYGRPDRSTAAWTRVSSSGIRLLPNRVIPALSPSASRRAWPTAIDVSSTVWWASISTSPLARTVRSRPPCLPSWLSMWSKNGTPVSTSTTPMPSRSSLTRIWVSWVRRSTRALRSRFTPAPPNTVSFDHFVQGRSERRHLLGGPDRDPEPAGRPDLADQHAPVDQPLPDRVSVGERAEQHEVGVRVGHGQAAVPQPGHALVPFGPQRGHRGQRIGRVGQGGPGHRLGHRRQVVGQPDDQ